MGSIEDSLMEWLETPYTEHDVAFDEWSIEEPTVRYDLRSTQRWDADDLEARIEFELAVVALAEIDMDARDEIVGVLNARRT